MNASMPRRRGRLLQTSDVRKARALRPALETCEARTMMSGATTRIAFEPLQFSAATVSPKGLPSEVAGTLHLTEGPKGGLAGTLVEADGRSLKVLGTLKGQRIDLSLRGPTGPTIHAYGPVVSATTAASLPTLHGGGLILGAGNHSQGTFTLQSSDVVLPAGNLPNPAKVARIIPAGTNLMPTNFVGTVTAGPDAGTTLSGVLSLGKVSGNGSFAGSLADPVNGTIPVTGRIAGQQIELEFHYGPGNTFGGVGPFVAQKVGKGQIELTSFGSLQTGNPADSGDWSVTNSPLSNQNLSSQGYYTLALNNNLLVGTNFMRTGFASINITNSILQSVNFGWSHIDDTPSILRYSTFQGVNFYGSNVLDGADLTGSDLTGASLSYAALAFANLTGTKLPSNLSTAHLDSTNLSGRQFANNNLSNATFNNANLAGANLTGANLTGADFTGANLRGTVITNVTGMTAKAQLEYQLQNQGGVGLNLSGQDLSGDDLQNVNLGGADLDGANLSNANLTGANLVAATLAKTNISDTQLTNAILSNLDLSTVTLDVHSATKISLDGANLSGANLSQLMLEGYDMVGANLSGANLSNTFLGTNLSKVNLSNANLYRAGLIHVDLSGANLTKANFAGADLMESNLRGAVITGATGLTPTIQTVYTLQNSGGVNLNISNQDLDREDLSNVNLTGANLSGDNLFGADLTGATLTKANFIGANLTATSVTATILTAAGAHFNSTTIFG